MKKLDRRTVFFMIFLILGIALSLQIRSTLHVNKQKAMAVLKFEQLKTLLDEEKDRGNKLKDLANSYEKKKEAYLKDFFDNKPNSDSNQEKQYLDRIKLEAGLTDVKGAGIIIKLFDAPAKMDENPNLFIIHDMDIVKVLNELKKAGAQAISINSERVIATSGQVCAGPTILINKNRYAVPYEVKAIGDPEIMFKSIDESEMIAVLREYSISVEISKSKDIFIPKYNSNTNNLISGLEVIDK